MHYTITRQWLVEELDRRGYRLRRLNPEHAGIAVKTVTGRYLDGERRRLIQQTLVPRTATQNLLSRTKERAATDSVMTGKAGSGKTACVVEVVEGLRARGLPVLVFRLDRVLPVSTTTDLGHRLDLEESPVLVLAAAAEAAECPGVLIVDQLDAVSTMSGRSSGAFELVEGLLHEARGTRARTTIHTVVVCRAFDWENDSRLRQLMPPDSDAQVEVTEFSVDEVKTILADAGFDPSLFRERQLKLLQLPQNLSLFLESGFNVSGEPSFNTVTDLFDTYWNKKRQSVAERIAPAPEQWMETVETLCNEMTAAQQLSVAKEKLDNVSTAYLDQVASEGVITFDGRRYGFGHESFFDYCFARVFFNRSGSLVSLLKGSEQHLFRRAQVRQVLAYLRDADPDRYAGELEALVTDDGIRTHIKDLAFALLAEVTDPAAKEWDIWQKWIAPEIEAVEGRTRNPNKLSPLAWRRIFGSPSWFKFIDGRGMIESWLASGNDGLADMAVKYLSVHHRHSPDRAAALLEPYADGGGEWPQRLRLVAASVDLHASRRMFDLFLRLIDNGTLDEVRRAMAMNSALLCEHRPEWVPDVLAHWISRRIAVIRTADGDLSRGEILPYDRAVADMFVNSAESAPAVFVTHLLPVVLDISDSALIAQDEPPKQDAVWFSYLVKTKYPSGERTLDALKSAAVRSDLTLEVCRKAFADSRESCGKSISDVLGSIEDPLPDYAVQMLHWLATEHRDPTKEGWNQDAPGGRKYYGGDIHMNGINTTRGRAALAIGDLIVRDAAYIDRFRPALDGMVRDPSASVLSCVARTLRAVGYQDPTLGISLFLQMSLPEDRLLATQNVYELIRGHIHDNFTELRPIVERMLRSSEPEVCQAGGRLASLANLQHDSAGDLVVEAVRGNSRQRCGVAQVAAANVAVPQCRAWCEATLATMFDDGDADVRGEAASCFDDLPDDSLDTYGDLIAAFCDSTAFRNDSFQILRVLESSLGRLPGMTCVICEKVLDHVAGEASEVAAGPSGDTYTLSKLIFRTYQQHQNDEWTSRVLDQIDRLCLEGIGGAGQQFEDFER